MTLTATSVTSIGIRRLIASLCVGIPILLVVLATLGALTEQTVPGLPTVPAITLWALPVGIWVRDASTALTLGAALIGGVLAPRPDPRLGRVASLSAIVWLVALSAQAVLTVSEVLAVSVSQSLDPTIVWSLLSQTTLGRVIVIQFVLVALVALLAWVVLDRITGVIILALVLVATFLPGFTGHSMISEGHESATISLGIHITAAATWIGGLIATVLYLSRRPPGSPQMVRRFSVIALICVILLAESGLLNAALRLGSPAELVTSQYGALILTKVALLIALIGFGWRHRQAIATGADEGVGSILKFATWQVALMGTALGLSVALSRTAPPAPSIAGTIIPVSVLVVLGLLVPLAARSWRGPSGRTPTALGRYPEIPAVALLVAMAVIGSLSTMGVTSVQVVALIALIVLSLLGWAFCTALQASTSPVALILMVVGLPIVAWWVERGVPGGLGWGTWLSVALPIGIIVLVVIKQPQAAESS
jgi:putative copper resistance protein D